MKSLLENENAKRALQGAFIERYSDGDRWSKPQNNLYVTSAVKKEQLSDIIGRKNVEARSDGISLPINGKPQIFFKLVVKDPVVAELKDHIPVVDTEGNLETRISMMKEGFEAIRRVKMQKTNALEFLDKHPDVATTINEFGVLVKPGRNSYNSTTLVLPREHLQEIKEAIADGLGIRVTTGKAQSPSPFYEAEGIEIRGHALEAIAGKAVDAARIVSDSDLPGMRAALRIKPEAKHLMEAMERQPELRTLLENKAFFLFPQKEWGVASPGAVAFNDEADAAAALEGLKKIPGYQKASLGDERSNVRLRCPHITMEACGEQEALMLSGFAGTTKTRGLFGESEEVPRVSTRAYVLENMMQREAQGKHAGHAEAEMARRETLDDDIFRGFFQ